MGVQCALSIERAELGTIAPDNFARNIGLTINIPTFPICSRDYMAAQPYGRILACMYYFANLVEKLKKLATIQPLGR